MKSITEQMQAYAAYHRDFRNKLTHFVGVPIIVYALFIPMAWFRFAPAPEVPLTGATIFFLSVFTYYLRLDRSLALANLPITIILYWLADQTAQLPFLESLGIFLVTFIGGWIIQFVGHYFEGRKPALLDNVMQIFNAPLFLTAEIFFMLGLKKGLKDSIEQKPAA